MFPILALALACSQPTGVSGSVVDLWDAPVVDAVVIVEGQALRLASDATGRFELPAGLTGAQTLKVGAKGYVHDYVEVDLTAEAEPRVVLYEKPADNGFHVVGHEDYVPLHPVRVERMGSELRSVIGMRLEPDVEVEGLDLDVVFHTNLKYSEVMQLGLELHKLEFQRETELPGPLGNAPVTVNMWVSAGEVDMSLEPMRSRSDFIIEADGLAPGAYAFHTQGLLDATSAQSFDALPPEVRVAFPFDIR